MYLLFLENFISFSANSQSSQNTSYKIMAAKNILIKKCLPHNINSAWALFFSKQSITKMGCSTFIYLIKIWGNLEIIFLRKFKPKQAIFLIHYTAHQIVWVYV